MDRDYNNYKPYRTKAQKAMAAKGATKRGDGAFRCHVPVSRHQVRQDLTKSTEARPALFNGPSKGRAGESVIVRNGGGRPVERLTAMGSGRLYVQKL